MAEGRPRAGRRGIGDIIGGFVAGLYSVPEGIGYASMAGINPMLGIYAGMVPVAVAAAATGSVLMMSTLTSAIALTMGGVLDSTSYTGDQISQAVFTMALLAGAVMVVLGLLRLGKVVNYVSNAVMTGFVMKLGEQNVLPPDPHLGASLDSGLQRGRELLAELQAGRPAALPEDVHGS